VAKNRHDVGFVAILRIIEAKKAVDQLKAVDLNSLNRK
jgi:hypothetical protein